MEVTPQWNVHTLLLFSLIYLTFFLDNVLITVLVPIIPDWVHGGTMPPWSGLGQLLNGTARAGADAAGSGGAAAGAVLAARALAQLLAAPLCAAAVRRRGPARVLRAATAVLAGAAIMFCGCGWLQAGAARALCSGGARAAQGAGGAAAGVGGLALGGAALPAGGLAALLPAAALGVLVGYPFGGIAYKMWGRGTPFLMIALVLVIDLGLQMKYLVKEEYNRPIPDPELPSPSDLSPSSPGPRRAPPLLAPPAVVGGALFLSAAVLAALEPCLPLWVQTRFHPERWALGVIFVPDSVGYLCGTALCAAWPAAPPLCAPPLCAAWKPLSSPPTSPEGHARVSISSHSSTVPSPRMSAPIALVGIGLATLVIPYAKSLKQLSVPQFVIGLGVGAVDGLLVPWLVRREGARGAARAGAASGAAGALGPALGAGLAAALSLHTLLRALACLHLLYAALLYDALSGNYNMPMKTFV